MADLLAARLAGTESMVNALDKLHFAGVFFHHVRKFALSDSNDDLFLEIRQLINTIPEREIERTRRETYLYTARLDSTHPPTVYRKEFLLKNRTDKPALNISQQQIDLLEKEMASKKKETQAKLVDQYRDGLYY